MKKIVIAGGTGFLGNSIIDYFKLKVDTIIVLTRGKTKTLGTVQYVHWDAKTIGKWTKTLEHADVLINMTGKSVDCRYTKINKQQILNSRTQSTSILGTAITQCEYPPHTWLNSSTATIYRGSLINEMDEDTGEIGTGFSVEVATAWERTFFAQHTPKTRKVALRTSIVLGKSGGALPPLKRLISLGLGGKQGSGNQKISWIHETDFVRSLDHIINTPSIQGCINIVSPKPIANYLFMNTLREVLGMPFGIPLPKSMLEIGAICIRTETELILKSRNVIPKKLIQHQFNFSYPDIKMALHDLIKS